MLSVCGVWWCVVCHRSVTVGVVGCASRARVMLAYSYLLMHRRMASCRLVRRCARDDVRALHVAPAAPCLRLCPSDATP
jgi:hypothetical protein